MRRTLITTFILSLFSSPVLAAHINDAVIYDEDTKIVLMVVVPDDDNELDDPAYNLKGSVQIRVPHHDGKNYIDQIDSAVNQVIGIKGPRQVISDSRAILNRQGDDPHAELADKDAR